MKFLCARLLCFIRWLCSLFWKRQMELAIVGLDGSGKSTFTHLISNGKFWPHPVSTIGTKKKIVTKGNVIIKIWDLSGQSRFRSSWARFCRGTNALLFMIDANEEQRFEEAKCELLQLLQIPALEGIPLLVLGNKADLITHKGEAIKELIECLELEVIGQQRLVGCFLVSCKDGLNIEAAMQWMLKNARK